MENNNDKDSQQVLIDLIGYLKNEKLLLSENDYQQDKSDRIANMILNIEKVLNGHSKLIDDRLRVLDIQEKERQRIARDLHDSSLQNLTHLIHKIELAGMYIDTDVIQAKLELATIGKSIKSIIEDIRNTIFDLRPMSFDDLGLRDSLERLILNLNSISELAIELNIGNINCNEPLILVTVLRIIQECATNAVKHSNGKSVSITLNESNSIIYIKIDDDGKGFDYEKINKNLGNHFGLKIMEERIKLLNGKLDYNSDHNGTKISIEIPNL